MAFLERSTPVIEASAAEGLELEELAYAVAEAVEEWAYRGGVSDLAAADAACNLASRLRALGWAAATPAHDAIGDRDGEGHALSRDLYEAFAHAADLLSPPPTSGVRGRTAPPPGYIDPAAVDEDDETVVRALRTRSTNRALR